MLVMTVKEHDFIMIGNDIRIQYIKDESSGSIRLGIEAPRSFEIARSKVYERELRDDPAASAEELERIRALRKNVVKEQQRRERNKRLSQQSV